MPGPVYTPLPFPPNTYEDYEGNEQVLHDIPPPPMGPRGVNMVGRGGGQGVAYDSEIPPPPSGEMEGSEKPPSFWDRLKPQLPTLIGAGVAALAGPNRGLGHAALGFAKGSHDVYAKGLEQRRQQEMEQEQNTIKNVDKMMEKLSRLSDPNDGRHARAQQIVKQYQQFMTDGKLTGKEAAKIMADAAGIGDIDSMVGEAENKQKEDLYRRYREIDQKVGKISTTMVDDPNNPGRQIPVNATSYWKHAEGIPTGADKPVVRQIRGPNGQPMWAIYRPEQNAFEPIGNGDISVRNRQLIYTDPITGMQTLVDAPASFIGGGGGGSAPSAPSGVPSPSSEIPPPPGGAAMISTPSGVPLGAKPTTVSAEAQAQLAGITNAYTQFKNVENKLHLVQGPLFGQVTMAEVERLGGLGADPAAIQMAVELRTLMANQAFANGGKQLTGTEKVEFEFQTPSMTDTIQQAAIKTAAALKILRNNYATKMAVMPVTQSRQLPGSVDGAAEKATQYGGIAPPPGSETREINGVTYVKGIGPDGRRGWIKQR